MYKFHIWALILVVSIIAPRSYSQNHNPQYSLSNEQQEHTFYHTVEAGQTIYAISIMYNIEEEDIYQMNPSSREYIRVGEKLKIKQGGKASSSDRFDGEIHIFHAIQPGETLYGVSKLYNVTAEQIVTANPGMDFKIFASGNTILVPATDIESLPTTEKKVITKIITYKIKKQETMYSICKKFNTTSDMLIRYNSQLKQGLKAGMAIKIPVEAEEKVTVTSGQTENEINALINQRNAVQKVNVINLALMLPFESSDAKSVAARTEYYEGFLLAVDSMRNLGVNIDLTVYDIGDGTQKTKETLKNEALTKANLIIGGISNEQIELIADFATKNQIKYVVPFSSKCDKLTSSNPYVFQVNTPYPFLYSYATTTACALFANYHIIILNTKNDKDDKSLFINTFKADMKHRNISFKELNFNEKSFRTDLSAILSTTKPNLIVPTSGAIEVLSKIKGPLRILAETKSNSQISLFGYPEWQTFSNQCLEDFYILNAHFYTPFFANNLSLQTKQFDSKFKRTYKKTMIASYPKYAMLGYDTGLFFMSAIHKYGLNFENDVEQIRSESIQTGFEFERVNNWGGFINTNLYMVSYNRDFTITRTRK